MDCSLPGSSVHGILLARIMQWACHDLHQGIFLTQEMNQDLLVTQLVKNQPSMQEAWVQSLGWEDPLEKGKATHSSILAWRILWTVQPMGSQRVGHDWATFTFTPSLKGILYQLSYPGAVWVYLYTFFFSNRKYYYMLPQDPRLVSMGLGMWIRRKPLIWRTNYKLNPGFQFHRG